MIQKLLKRFFRIALLALTAAMVLVTAAINIANWINVRYELYETLETVAASDNGQPGFAGFDRKSRHMKGMLNEARTFTVSVSSDGSVSVSTMRKEQELSEKDAAALALKAADSSRRSGFLDDYLFLRSAQQNGETRIVFLNCETRLNAVRRLLLFSFCACVLGIALAVLAGSDGVHTEGNALIESGTYTIQVRDDGIHADEKAEIAGGTLNITGSEGIEANYVLISGGDVTIQATDDGINAARKSDACTPTVEITGGAVTVTMGSGNTDGIDSNGDIIISGGVISVNGNSAFDYDGSASFTGGTVYVNGQQVTTLPNQMMGGRGGRGGMGDFGGNWFKQR